MGEDTDPLYRCEFCGNVAPLDDWDVLGADVGNVFCNACGREQAPEMVEIPQETTYAVKRMMWIPEEVG